MNKTEKFEYIDDSMGETLQKGNSYPLKKTSVAINDIVAFKFHSFYDNSDHQGIGRVIGKPGDTISIKNVRIYRNGIVFHLPESAVYHYKVYLKDFTPEIEHDLKITSKFLNYYDSYLTDRDSATVIKKYSGVIDSIKKEQLPINNAILLNGRNNMNWSLDDFGPIAAPRIGGKVPIGYLNLAPNIANDSVSITHDCFFIVGDNFQNSFADSRYLGLVSENSILGTIVVHE